MSNNDSREASLKYQNRFEFVLQQRAITLASHCDFRFAYLRDAPDEHQAEARKMAMAGHEGPNLTLRVHPEIAKALKTRESLLMDELEQTSHKHIIIQSVHWEQYDIY